MGQQFQTEPHDFQERETEYTGPVTVTRLEFRGRPISVVRPADPDRLLDDPLVRQWNQRDDYMPYWAYLWPGALFLAEVVASEPWPVSKESIPSLQGARDRLRRRPGRAGRAGPRSFGLLHRLRSCPPSFRHTECTRERLRSGLVHNPFAGLARPSRRDLPRDPGLGRSLRAPAGAPGSQPAGETAPAWRRGPDRLSGSGFGRRVFPGPHVAWPGLSCGDDRSPVRGRPGHPRRTLPGEPGSVSWGD